MRQVKYRAINHETAGFVYGYYTRLQEGARRFDAIISEDGEHGLTRYYIHDKNTIGQYTGLKDSKGVEIYGGDIVYIAGYGNHTAEFPFIDLYEAAAENDIGEILGNIYKTPELAG